MMTTRQIAQSLRKTAAQVYNAADESYLAEDYDLFELYQGDAKAYHKAANYAIKGQRKKCWQVIEYMDTAARDWCPDRTYHAIYRLAYNNG